MLIRSLYNVEIPKRNSCCFKCQEPLAGGADYYAVLYEQDDGQFLRHDYCCACWEKGVKDELPSTLATVWKSRVPKKIVEKELYRSRDEKALALLKEYSGKDDQEEQLQAFILALYLARKRIIYLRKEVALEDNSPAQFFEVAETEEMLVVRKFELTQSQVVELQAPLAKKLLLSAKEDSLKDGCSP